MMDMEETDIDGDIKSKTDAKFKELTNGGGHSEQKAEKTTETV
jgi:hypothetical protein